MAGRNKANKKLENCILFNFGFPNAGSRGRKD